MTATVFTTLGVNHVIDILDGSAATRGGTRGWFIGWGTGGSSTGATATEGNVDLAAFATNAEGNVLGRASATAESQPAAHQLRWVRRLTSDLAAEIIEEVGLFAGGTDANGSTSTTTQLWIRASHGQVSLATGDQIEYTITLSATGG